MMKCAPIAPAKSAASTVRFTRLLADRAVGRDEPAAAEDRVEVQAGRDAVDAVAVERRADLVEVVGAKLLG